MVFREAALKQLARRLMKPMAAAVDLIRKPTPGITVLIYHRVGAGTDGEVDLDPHVFDAQMAELAASGRVVSLDRAVEVLGAPTADTEDSVVITFDDGTPDVVEVAMPILERHQVPMTLYLATGSVEADRGFWRPEDPTISWQALRDAMTTGLLDVGSHTHSHALLDRLAPAEIGAELDRSVDLIGDHLGVEARHFAYPKALPPSQAADTEVRSRFASAALAGTRANAYGTTDVHALARSPIQRSDGMRWFRHKARGGLGLEDRLRDQINRRRYADAVR